MRGIVYKMARFIKYLFPKLLLQEKKLQRPTHLEKELAYELKSSFDRMAVTVSNNKSKAEKVWNNNRRILHNMVLKGDPRKFLRWDVIQATMFSNKFFHNKLLKYLKQTDNWESVWKKTVVEIATGHPIPFFLYPISSGTTIQHSYHLCRFEEETGERFDKIDLIFEFGGGYGNMCRIIHKLNFKGKYIIFDLPEISALQTYYLKAENIPVCTTPSFSNSDNCVICLSDVGQIQELLSNKVNHNSLFIATWSLSEMPMNNRETILNLIHGFNHFLISYQSQFAKIDNIKFFKEMAERFKNIKWYAEEMKYIPRHHYLIGSRKLNSN